MPADGASGASAPVGGAPDATLRIGSWNVTHWTAATASVVATSVLADVLAVQETHLAPLPLLTAHTTAENHGLHLHHGRPAQAAARSDHGKSCGVGFLARHGIALSTVVPACPAWRRLHAMRRLHGARLASRPGLPHGLLLLSVYAPLQAQAERRAFDTEFAAMTFALDMQVPTLLLGDFNGSINPTDDYQSASGSRRPPCALLAELLGPVKAMPWRARKPTPQDLPWSECTAACAGRPW